MLVKRVRDQKLMARWNGERISEGKVIPLGVSSGDGFKPKLGASRASHYRKIKEKNLQIVRGYWKLEEAEGSKQ